MEIYLLIAMFCGAIMGYEIKNEGYIWAGIMCACVLINLFNAFQSLN